MKGKKKKGRSSHSQGFQGWGRPDVYWDRRQRSTLRDREMLVSPVERLRLWTSGLRGREGARGTEPRRAGVQEEYR